MEPGYVAGLVLIGYILIQVQVADCINCLNCKNIADLSNCDDVIHCTESEVCYIDKVFSPDSFQALYNTGCRSMKYCTLNFCYKQAYADANARIERQTEPGEIMTLCSECCFEDICNTEGCGYVHHPKNVPQCYSCNEVYEGGPPCTRTEDCDLNLFSCSITLNRNSQHAPAYDLGCRYKRDQCRALLSLTADQQDPNVKCCDTPLCNSNPYHRKINKTALALNFSCPTGIVRPTTTPLTTTFIPTTTTTKTTTTTTTTVHSSCPKQSQSRTQPASLFQHGLKCYELVILSRSWYHARNDCHGKGGHLLSIENAEEQVFIYDTLRRMNITQSVWLGLSDKVNEEQWNWDSGKPVTYVNWMPGRLIDKYHDQENCGILVTTRSGQWDDVDCNAMTSSGLLSLPWICQYSRTKNDTAALATWSSWFYSPCSVTCGTGTASRLRRCSSGYEPDCTGKAFETVPCDEGHCPL